MTRESKIRKYLKEEEAMILAETHHSNAEMFQSDETLALQRATTLLTNRFNEIDRFEETRGDYSNLGRWLTIHFTTAQNKKPFRIFVCPNEDKARRAWDIYTPKGIHESILVLQCPPEAPTDIPGNPHTTPGTDKNILRVIKEWVWIQRGLRLQYTTPVSSPTD